MMNDNAKIRNTSVNDAHLLVARSNDLVRHSLSESGTLPGLSAAAALATIRKRHRPLLKFEVNPAVRKRIQTRLIRKIQQTVHELSAKCGQQAAVVFVNPGSGSNSDGLVTNPSTLKVFGSSPLDQAILNSETTILRTLETNLRDSYNKPDASPEEILFQLPNLAVDGIPTSVDEMNQAQLRMFIPEMLKFSTGRGKPGWGKESTKPIWWPPDVPWANVRRDARSEDSKLKVSWTQALRQIVKNCYQYHNREDLLLGVPFSQLNGPKHVPMAVDENDALDISTEQNEDAVSFSHPTLVQTVHNADGSVSLVQLDSGQTIATIEPDSSGAAVATIRSSSNHSQAAEIDLGGSLGENWVPFEDHSPIIEEAFNAVSTSMPIESTSPQKALDVHNLHPLPSLLDAQALSFIFENSNSEVKADDTVFGNAVSINSTGNGSATVQIPVSVYEKIAHSIQNTSDTQPTVTISADGRIHIQKQSTKITNR